jgi:hypothetical protein
MHIVMMGDAQLQLFSFEHEQREREAQRERLVTEAMKLARTNRAARPAPARGFIPRIAGALGLF